MSNIELMIISTKYKLEEAKRNLQEAKERIAESMNDAYINTDGIMHNARRIREAQIEISIYQEQLQMLESIK